MGIQLTVVLISILEPMLTSSLPQYHWYLLYILKAMLASILTLLTPPTLNPPPLQLTGFPPLATPSLYNPLSLLCCSSVSIYICVSLSLPLPPTYNKNLHLNYIIEWSSVDTVVEGLFICFVLFVCFTFETRFLSV